MKLFLILCVAAIFCIQASYQVPIIPEKGGKDTGAVEIGTHDVPVKIDEAEDERDFDKFFQTLAALEALENADMKDDSERVKRGWLKKMWKKIRRGFEKAIPRIIISKITGKRSIDNVPTVNDVTNVDVNGDMMKVDSPDSPAKIDDAEDERDFNEFFQNLAALEVLENADTKDDSERTKRGWLKKKWKKIKKGAKKGATSIVVSKIIGKRSMDKVAADIDVNAGVVEVGTHDVPAKIDDAENQKDFNEFFQTLAALEALGEDIDMKDDSERVKRRWIKLLPKIFPRIFVINVNNKRSMDEMPMDIDAPNVDQDKRDVTDDTPDSPARIDDEYIQYLADHWRQALEAAKKAKNANMKG